MENLLYTKSRFTMEVNFNKDTGVLLMDGCSYPENSFNFFGPIMDWVREFVVVANVPVVFNLKLNYLNTSTAKVIIEILEQLIKYRDRTKNSLEVNWYYEESDEDILETGMEVGEDLPLKINYISYVDPDTNSDRFNFKK